MRAFGADVVLTVFVGVFGAALGAGGEGSRHGGQRWESGIHGRPKNGGRSVGATIVDDDRWSPLAAIPRRANTDLARLLLRVTMAVDFPSRMS
jgi:hypothetical protein